MTEHPGERHEWHQAGRGGPEVCTKCGLDRKAKQAAHDRARSVTAPMPDLTEAIDAAYEAYQVPSRHHRANVEVAVRAAAEVLVPKAQAAERERIAQAIEAHSVRYDDPEDGDYRQGLLYAARIARGES